MISLIDHNIGRILLHMQATGLDRNTLVIFTTDHGEWLGDHGLILKGPMAYEGLLRVGFIVIGPGVPSPITVVLADTSVVEPDIVYLAKDRLSLVGARGTIDGRAMNGDESRDYAYSEWDLRASRCGVDLWLRTVRTRRHKLTVELNSKAGELYALADDPLEMDNRFDDPAIKAVRKELEDMIASRPDDVMVPPLPQVGMA